MTDWFDNDDFWETMGPCIFREERLSQVGEEVDAMVAFLGIEPGDGVVDMCCGPGRHSLELARRGFKVTGVDRTSTYLDRAKKSAKAEGLDIEFVHEDMRNFCREDAFDGAINFYTSFGYFDDPADDKKVIANIHRSLKANASMIMDTMSKEVLARKFQERTWEEVDGALLLEEREVTQDWSRCENRWILIKDGIQKEFNFSLRLYSAFELSGLIKECGFCEVRAYGDLSGAPYDHEAKRLIVVAKK